MPNRSRKKTFTISFFFHNFIAKKYIIYCQKNLYGILLNDKTNKIIKIIINIRN